MCLKCEPALECDYSESSSKKVAEQLVSAVADGNVSSRWFDKLWRTNYRTHNATLGNTLRRELCVPALTGDDLRAVYRDAIDEVGICDAPAWLTTADCENQKVASKNGQKLSRALAAYFLERSPTLSTDYISRKVEEVQNYVKSRNGMKLVLSANPLDKLLASNFAAYAGTTCHRWFEECGREPGEYSAGNHTYANDPNVLILYTYSTFKVQHSIKLPNKTWRQVVYLHESTAFLAKHYGQQPIDLVHNMARKAIAELLTGQENPTWKLWQGGNNPASTSYAYNDSISNRITAGDDRKNVLSGSDDSIDLAEPICPCCGNTRGDEDKKYWQCESCRTPPEYDYHCDACGDGLSEDDIRCASNGSCYCEDCYFNRYFNCNRCGDDANIDEAIETANDDNICQDCYENYYFTCTTCEEVLRTRDQFTSDDGECYCESCFDELPENNPDDTDENGYGVNEPAPASCAGQLALAFPPDEPITLELGKRYVTRNGDVTGELRTIDPNSPYAVTGCTFQDSTTSALDSWDANGRFHPSSRSVSEHDIIREYIPTIGSYSVTTI